MDQLPGTVITLDGEPDDDKLIMDKDVISHNQNGSVPVMGAAATVIDMRGMEGE